MEMSEEDQPEEGIWLDPEALEAHFNSVKERWRNKYGGGTGNGSWESIEDAPMTENELAKEWRRE